jgi:cytochrome c553
MRRAIVLIASLALIFVVLVIAYSADSSIDHGKEVFAAQKCPMCHSIAGVGNKKYPLDGIGSKMKAEALKEFAKNPKGTKPNITMKAYSSLSDKDLDDLVAYMLTLKK